MSSETRINKIYAWAENIPEVKSWLTKIQSKKAGAFDLYRFCEWAHKTPTELLALKDNPSSKAAETLLDNFITESEFTNAVTFNLVNAVKSFFKWNYRDLARASGSIELIKVKPTNLPNKANLRKLRDWCQNPRDRSLITFTASTAVAKGSIVQLKWSHLEEGWEKIDLPCVNLPSEIIKGHGRGKYKDVKQTSFLTPEAKRDLLVYKEWIEQRIGRTLTGDDNIFLETDEPFNPVTYGRLGTLIWELSRSAGVVFSWHDARRYVNTALEQINISPNWARKIRGRKVKGEEAPYSRPAIDQLREKFREAVPLLEFVSEKQVTIPPEVAEKLKALEEEQRKLKRKYGIQYRKMKPNPEENRKPDCPDGVNCPEFKQIKETELLAYLKEGWQIEHNCVNRQVIIRRE